ncbi:hypothetical protein Q4489_12880 [Thalassotalea sp. 1_MG-2023]|uniref:hypothetical protein n=1 Tax=Thalassotalea sp. 1_MG-2023 TaxID=3062680 RepID=UPI0026E19506|nr:hypothetical protein [Thalassotalea sp. 1_MG-2023]MDO6427916.1 hypothetical protein [Thalassotalea sp. 1_MG-2023]
MIAVLTGDLVNSSKMSTTTYSQVVDHLNDLLQDSQKKYQASGEIYRGDEFQIHYPEPIDALKSTLLIKLALHIAQYVDKPIQCTLSLAYGSYENYKNKPNTSSGPVYIASGRMLAKTPKGDLSLSVEQTASAAQLTLLTTFLSHLINKLTKTQASLLYQYIESDFTEHRKLAKITNTSRQNISNRLANIGGHLVRDYMQFIHQEVLQFKEFK